MRWWTLDRNLLYKRVNEHKIEMSVFCYIMGFRGVNPGFAYFKGIRGF
jgi:hypothetical protein